MEISSEQFITEIITEKNLPRKFSLEISSQKKFHHCQKPPQEIYPWKLSLEIIVEKLSLEIIVERNLSHRLPLSNRVEMFSFIFEDDKFVVR